MLLAGILTLLPPVHGGVVFQTTWGGPNGDVGQGVAIDTSGNTYVTGYTSSFGPGTQLFLLKLNQTGSITWQRLWHGGHGDAGKGVAVDKSGNVYVVGYTNSFGAGGNDVLLLKFDASGNMLWQKTWGGTSEDVGQGIAVDSQGNIYVTGYTDSTPSGQPNAFLLKFDSTANLLWQHTWGGSAGNLGQGVAVDAGGNIYVTGATLTSDKGNMDAFILKFSSTGALSWQETWNGTSDSVGYGVAVDPSNNSYITGYTQSFGAGGDDAFIIKLKANGDLAWQRTWGGSATDIGQAISIDILGYVYVAGTTQSFNAGHSDVFLLDLDGGGNLRWATVWGSASDSAFGVTAAPSGYAIVTGYVSESGPYVTYDSNLTLGVPNRLVLNVNKINLSIGTPTFSTGNPAGTVSTPSGSTSYGGGQDAFILKFGLPTTTSPPRNLVAKASVAVVSLTWIPPAFNGFNSITGYNVYRSTHSGSEVIVASLGNVTAYNDTGLRGGVTYYYQVTALNGKGESPPSTEASAYPTSAPSAPKNPSATASIQTVQVNWTTPDSTGGSIITGYNVYRGTASGAESLLASVGISNIFYDSPLTGGVTYYYRVTAVNIIGESSFSKEVSATPTSTASPPQSVQAIPSAGRIILTWTAPSSTGGSPITGYNVYRGSYSGGEARIAQLPVQYSFTDTRVDNVTTYFYYITSVNSVGESAPSIEVNAKASSSANVPTAPRNLVATPGKNSVLLGWNLPVSNGGNSISGYDVLRGTSPSNLGFFTGIANVTAYNDTSATAGATYFYEVAARNAFGEGSVSNVQNAKPFTTPSAPVNFQAYPSLGKNVLTWNPPAQNGFSQITGYRVFRGTVSGQASFLSAIGNQTYFIDKNVVAATPYYYNITAVNAAGESPHSLQASATPTSSPTNPSPPQNLIATGRNGTVILNWTAPVSNGGVSLTSYEIWRGGVTGQETLIKTVGNVTSYVDAPLQGGTPYYYEVKAINIQPLRSGFSNEAIATPTSTPSVPGSLTATAGSGKVTLTWTTPSSNGGLAINGYKIYRGTTSGTEVLMFTINNGGQLSYVDMSVTGGVTYYYRVTAFNSLGQSNSSNEASATPTTPPPPVNPPDPPTGLTATPGVSNITLTWTTPASNGGRPITGYQIFRGTTSGSETLISATDSSTTTFADTGLTPGTTYYYYVKAVNSAGSSVASNEASGTPLTPQSPPSSPQNLRATAGVNQVNLTWTPPASNGGATITGYQIYRGTSIGGETLYQSATSANTYLDQSVTDGVTYYYKIKAINSVGPSGFSNEASATPVAPIPPSNFPIIPVAIAALLTVAVGAIGVIFWRRRVSQRLMMPP